MAKLLIVDDEENILKALWRELFEEDLEVETASSAEAALKLLEKERFEMVISDVRMPGMDGLRLLEAIQLRFPYMNRAILSGFVDQSAALDALAKGIATAFIPKPWEKNALLTIIRKALEIQRTLSEWKLLDVVTHIENIPTLPRHYFELSRLLKKEASARQVAELIQKDAGMTMRVLQVANSAFYSWRKVTSVERAVTMIGMDGIRNILLLTSILSKLNMNREDMGILSEIMAQSQVVNKYVVEFHQKRAKTAIPESLACVAVLQDIGKILMLQYLPDQLKTIRSNGGAPSWSEFFNREQERGYTQCTHQEIGAYFLKWWNLPDEMVEAVLFHHTPWRASEDRRELLETLEYLEGLVAWAWDNRRDDKAEPSAFRSAWISDHKLSSRARDMREELCALEENKED